MSRNLMKCKHRKKEHYCDCGEIYWCPDCGGLGVKRVYDANWKPLTPYEGIFGRSTPVNWQEKWEWKSPRMAK